MNRLFTLMAGVVTLGLYFVIAPVVTDTYRRYRKRKAVICPDEGEIAEVELKAMQAGIMSAFGKHWIRVKWCSLWPRKKDCAQECIEDWWSRE